MSSRSGIRGRSTEKNKIEEVFVKDNTQKEEK